MCSESKSLFFVLIGAACLAALIPGSSAQVRLEFTGSTEFPSLKCIIKPQQVDWDINNKTVCFCVWIQYVIPTWNCIKGDGKVTMDDLKLLMESIKNITQAIPIIGPQIPMQQGENRGDAKAKAVEGRMNAKQEEMDVKTEEKSKYSKDSNNNNPFSMDDFYSRSAKNPVMQSFTRKSSKNQRTASKHENTRDSESPEEEESEEESPKPKSKKSKPGMFSRNAEKNADVQGHGRTFMKNF